MNKLFFNLVSLIIIFCILSSCQTGQTNDQSNTRSESSTPTLRALIVDGQNNHGAWPKTTVMMKDFLEQTGKFEVDVERTAFTWQGPHNDGDENLDKEQRLSLLEKYPIESGKQTTMVEEPRPDPDYKPDFSKYDVVISNFGWNAASWPKETQDALENYVRNGGGLVIIHAASNSFPEWLEYNKMIGLGGWGDRTEKDGPYVYYNDANKLIRDTSPGAAGSHGPQHEYIITIRDKSHPITKNMPEQWKHTKDELYDQLRGPAENMNILGTAYSAKEKGGSARHEPMMFTIDYGQGRVFHTLMGHTDYSMECVGFIVTLQRSAEWAATGEVTQEIPDDFPTADQISARSWNYRSKE